MKFENIIKYIHKIFMRIKYGKYGYVIVRPNIEEYPRIISFIGKRRSNKYKPCHLYNLLDLIKFSKDYKHLHLGNRYSYFRYMLRKYRMECENYVNKVYKK